MALNNLGAWLLEQPDFVQTVNMLTANTALSELGDAVTAHPSFTHLHQDWSHLLFAASVLAASEAGQCQSVALRIAQSCLLSATATSGQRDSAGLLLDVLSNHPALDVAFRKELLEPNLRKRLPAGAKLEWTRRSIEYSVPVGTRHLRVNAFQKKFWTEVGAHDWLSFSAPTSAGKSFIVTRWMLQLLRSNSTATLVYLVPTRALISQVEADLKQLFRAEGVDVNVSSIPLARSFVNGRANVFVFTQERLHIFVTARGKLSVAALIVDEAHKVGDRQRGVLLQQVIERVSSDNPAVRAVFASPMTSNPEALLSEAREESKPFAFTSEQETVTQNLYWVSQVPRKPLEWDVSLCLDDTRVPLGKLTIPALPSPASKRLPFVAFAIGHSAPGNVIYVNGAADAEKLATQLYDLMGPKSDTDDSEIKALIDYSQRVVHKDFLLATVLRRRIAFHYGNLPLLIRAEIERLFSSGAIRFLVCTSTLIEGVNMACRNIYLRGPHKGSGTPMNAEDFWNLAGRAGRWGKELQGNIFCVDAAKQQVWGPQGPPTKRTRYQIRRTSDDVLAAPQQFIEFLKSGAPNAIALKRPEFETVFSYLSNVRARFGSVCAAPWSGRFPKEQMALIDETLKATLDPIDIPTPLIEGNPGISPLGMNNLLAYFRERTHERCKPIEELVPPDPASDDAPEAYAAIFGRLAKTTTPRLAPTPKWGYMLALLVTKWMRGYPLARLISERIDWAKKHDKPINTARAIRGVMEDVEQIARFEAPRALACYRDVLRFHLEEESQAKLIDDIPDFSVLLEYGVAQQTQVSLISVGLSRSTAVALSEIIVADDFDEEKVVKWLIDNERLWREADLPELSKTEVMKVMESIAHGSI
jgi:hypothetical protein